MTTVLVTGAAGYIASYLLPELRARYDLRLVDVREADGRGRPVAGLQIRDVSDPARLDDNRDLFRGADAVVHLAFLRPRGPSNAERYLAERGNVDMAYAVYQLAQDESVRRVVVASSNHAADSYEGPLRAQRLDMVYPGAPRPLSDNFYGWAKEAYEHLGFVYAAGRLGRPLEVVQIRIGAPRDLAITSFVDGRRDDPATLHRDLGMWVSPRDLAQLFVRSIDAPDIRDELGVPFQVFYGISANTRSSWSIANARRVVGYAPRDNSEVVYADEIRRHLVDPARPAMVRGEDRGGLGHR
jgi:uronate dehydrogenase/NAD+ dependent glucose-6-phosphate dehydrogenase